MGDGFSSEDESTGLRPGWCSSGLRSFSRVDLSEVVYAFLMRVAVVRETLVFLEAFRTESPSCMHKSTCSLRERSSFLRAILFLLATVCALIEGGIICFRRSGGDRD